jgi:O-antigen/teichoic acid export membrane protein
VTDIEGSLTSGVDQDLRQRILQFSKRPFVRNVAAVATGTAASQVILMAFSPIITRLYGPAAYGIQGVFLSIASIMATIAAMSYPIAIVLPKSDADAAVLCRLSILISIAMSLLVTVILFFRGPEILTLLNAGEILSFMYLIPLAMLISVFGAVMSQWLIRKKYFTLSAKVTVCQTLATSIFKAGLGFVYPTAAVLVVTSTLTGLLSPILMLLGKCRSTDCAKGLYIEIKDFGAGPSTWALASRYRDFPLLRTPQVLINVVAQSMPILLLASYFGSTAAGYYSIAFSVLGVPVALIGGSVMQVFYPRFNEAVAIKQDVVSLLTKATFGMAVLGIVPFAIVVIFGPFLFEFAFGVEWRTAGEYAQWLAVGLFFSFINRPAVSAIPVIRIQGMFLAYEILSVFTRIAALYIGFIILGSDIVSIASFSIVGCGLNCILIYYVIRACRKITTNER